MRLIITSTALCAALFVTAAASALAAPGPTPLPSPAPSPEASHAPAAPAPSGPSAAASPAGEEGAESYDKFTEGAVSQSGLFTVWRKQGKVYFELSQAQLDHAYLVVPILASGAAGQFFLFSGLEYDTALLKFHRAGSKILSVLENPHAKARASGSAAAAVAISYPESVVSEDALTAVSKANGNVVFPADVFLTDFVDIADQINGPPTLVFRPSFHYRLDAQTSSFGPTKAFPKNVNVEADLNFASQTETPVDVAPDSRSLLIRVHYSVVELPTDGYRPRIADDRLGYFLTARRQYDSYSGPTSFVRYINRWNIQKADPTARVSRAQNPIVYYLSNTIPARYRGPIRDALLTWNKAFEAIGITHAIEVRRQPNDPSWDPDDARYTVVRWIASPSDTFAYGPSFTDPRTGEIFRADIVIDGNIVRAASTGFSEIVDPTRKLSPRGRVACSRAECDYGYDMAEQAAWGALALGLDGEFGPSGEAPQWYLDAFLKSIVLHEAGHNLGLRHNFASSTIFTRAQLHDKRFTHAHGLVGSVMEYTPINLSPHGQPQGDYFQTILGPWDYFSIRYGYEPISAASSEGELPELRRLASRTSRPELAYGTDEDADWFTGFATDPRVNQNDLTSDPLGYAADVFAIDQRLFNTLTARLPRPGHSYAEDRRAFEILLRSRLRVSLLATHFISGEYFSRSHRGDPRGTLPFRPVSRTQEKRAFDLLARYVFADDAFRFPPKLLNSLGDERYAHWESDPNALGRLDFPLGDYVQFHQVLTLILMWQPTVLSRLDDLESRVAHPGNTMTLADLFDWTDDAVWGDLFNPRLRTVPAAHRALQQRYAQILEHIMLNPDPGTPLDAQSLARHHLTWLSRQLSRVLARGGVDETTLANFEDVRNSVGRALNATTVLPAF